jgi:phage terminase Nu1 subunit (DNA packaging protein)
VNQSRHVAKANAEIDVAQSNANFETIESAQRRKETALADKHEADARKRIGELVDVSEEERNWATVAQTVKEQLMGIPERIAGDLAALTDARMVRDKLLEEIRLALRNLPAQISAARQQSTDQPAN